MYDANGNLITLYSGVSDSVLYNITNEAGNLNVAIGQELIVSGYLSTTTEKQFALEWGTGRSIAVRNNVMLFVRPLPKGSKAAYLNIIIPNSPQYEMLFPTNVKFVIDKIWSRNDPEMDSSVYLYGYSYEIWINETETKNIQPVKSGKDPRMSEYVCKDIDNNGDNNNVETASRSFSALWFAVVFLFICSLI